MVQESKAFRTKALSATGENGFYVTSKLCSEVLTDNYRQFMDIIVLRLFLYAEKCKNLTCSYRV